MARRWVPGFGIATVLGLLVGMATPMRGRPTDGESIDVTIRRAVAVTVARWSGRGLALVFGWCVGSALGWVQ